MDELLIIKIGSRLTTFKYFKWIREGVSLYVFYKGVWACISYTPRDEKAFQLERLMYDRVYFKHLFGVPDGGLRLLFTAILRKKYGRTFGHPVRIVPPRDSKVIIQRIAVGKHIVIMALENPVFLRRVIMIEHPILPNSSRQSWIWWDWAQTHSQRLMDCQHMIASLCGRFIFCFQTRSFGLGKIRIIALDREKRKCVKRTLDLRPGSGLYRTFPLDSFLPNSNSAAAILHNKKGDEELARAYVHDLFRKPEFKTVPLVPLYLIQLISKLYRMQYLHLIHCQAPWLCNKDTECMLHIRIRLRQIFDFQH